MISRFILKTPLGEVSPRIHRELMTHYALQGGLYEEAFARRCFPHQVVSTESIVGETKSYSQQPFSVWYKRGQDSTESIYRVVPAIGCILFGPLFSRFVGFKSR